MKQTGFLWMFVLMVFAQSALFSQDAPRRRRAPRKSPEQRLIEAAMSNDIAVVRRLLVRAKVPADTTYGYSPTVLQIAVSNGNMEMAQMAVRRGADINLVNNRTTALHIAADLRRLDMIAFLYRRKANPSVQNSQGQTPLQLAASKEDLQVMQALMVPSNLNEISANPLMLATAKNQLERVRALLSEGFYTFGVDVNGYLPLHYAAVLSSPAILQELLPHYDINAKTHKNITAILLAAKNNRTELLRPLLDARANIADRDENGNTPLHLAVIHNAIQAAEALILLNAPTREVNQLGRIPLDLARNGPLKTKLQASYDLPVAVERGNTALVNNLLRRGAFVDIAHTYGNRPLHIAVERGHIDTARALIAARASIDITNEYGNAPIHLAASSGDTNMISLLVRSRARINERNRGLELPIQLAILNDHRDAVILLKNLGSELYDGVDVYLAQSQAPAPQALNTSENLEVLLQQQRSEQLRQQRNEGAQQRIRSTRVIVRTNQRGRIITNVVQGNAAPSNRQRRAPAQ